LKLVQYYFLAVQANNRLGVGRAYWPPLDCIPVLKAFWAQHRFVLLWYSFNCLFRKHTTSDLDQFRASRYSVEGSKN